MIDKCGEELLADFQHYYQLDLGDVLRPGSGLTARKALVFIRQLPLESATAAALRGGPEFRGWGPDRYLLARLVDALNENTFAFIAANSKKKPKRPKPVELPDHRIQRKQNPTGFAAIAAERLRAAREAKKGAGGDGAEGSGG